MVLWRWAAGGGQAAQARTCPRMLAAAVVVAAGLTSNARQEGLRGRWATHQISGGHRNRCMQEAAAQEKKTGVCRFSTRYRFRSLPLPRRNLHNAADLAVATAGGAPVFARWVWEARSARPVLPAALCIAQQRLARAAVVSGCAGGSSASGPRMPTSGGGGGSWRPGPLQPAGAGAKCWGLTLIAFRCLQGRTPSQEDQVRRPPCLSDMPSASPSNSHPTTVTAHHLLILPADALARRLPPRLPTAAAPACSPVLLPEAKKGQFPSIAVSFYQLGDGIQRVLCGGSLIRPSVVLLAGKHASWLCTRSAPSFRSSAARPVAWLAFPAHGTPAALEWAWLLSRHSGSPPAHPHQQAQLPLPMPACMPIMVSPSAGHCVADFGDLLGDVMLGLIALNDTKAPTRKVKVSASVGGVDCCLAPPGAAWRLAAGQSSRPGGGRTGQEWHLA
jgi:hypothetical protein